VRAGAERDEPPLLAAAGLDVRAGADLADPPLREGTDLVVVPDVPPLRVAGREVVDREVPPLRTVGRLVVDRLPPLPAVDLLALVPPPRTVVLGVAAVFPPPLLFTFTFTEGLVVMVLDAGGEVRDVALDPVAGLRSNTGRPVPEEGGVRVVRPGCGVAGAAVPPAGLLVVLLPFPPGALYPDDPLTDLGCGLPPERAVGVVFRGWTLLLVAPSTPGWETGGGFLTTTCGVPGSPLALSLKEKWAVPLLGWA
jgi:hypothetical protein